MSEIANSEGTSESEKPVHNDVQFPPFPDPTADDFDEDISEEERNYYKNKFKDLNSIKSYRLHCTSCDRHLGCSARNEQRMRAHPLLRTLVCHSCHTFYNSGEFEKGDDGSELYCRWCGQGGQVYCCSDCPHVFCAKCIKRNLGVPKIKEIENADDWKCFKCNPDCLIDLRAICWAVLRYCDLKIKIACQTQDPELKSAYLKDSALDLSECCKHKTSRKNQKLSESMSKKKEIKKEADAKATAANIISKMPSTIQVKKFASVNPEESPKLDKKAQKRSASPKQKIMVKNPISLAPCTKLLNPVSVPPLAKKIRLPNCSINYNSTTTPIRFPNLTERKSVTTYARIRPKMTATHLPVPITNNCFNGFNANVYHVQNPVNDNINLSLESLTQGLDMAAVAALSNNAQDDDDVVCTPDFPLEPLCEVTEDNDDDVQCITPGPAVIPKMPNPPPLVPRGTPTNADVVPAENIIQMTENDVTVNETTGGLKFRVDPQTLSSNKMYRLPDGRIFAINANPNMPGGYSATIVAVTEANKSVPKGPTFAAKLSSISTSTPASKNNRAQVTRFINTKRSTPNILRTTRTSETSTRECDLNVPVEWYRYNLIDAVDALEYSLSRLNKLKKEATSVYLRTRSVNEMRNLHRTFERLLNTSSCRFNEIRENLNKGLKQYVLKKKGGHVSEDDDDVEILPDMDDDPIFIDENSVESNMNSNENQEVDLTGPGSSEYNDSAENRSDMDPLNISQNEERAEILIRTENNLVTIQRNNKNDTGEENKINGIQNAQKEKNVIAMITEDFACDETLDDMNGESGKSPNNDNTNFENKNGNDNTEKQIEDKADNQVIDKNLNADENTLSSDEKIQDIDEKTQDPEDKLQNTEAPEDKLQNTEAPEDKLQNTEDKTLDNDDKLQDPEMSEEMIETLLKDDNSRDNATPNSEVQDALHVT